MEEKQTLIEKVEQGYKEGWFDRKVNKNEFLSKWYNIADAIRNNLNGSALEDYWKHVNRFIKNKGFQWLTHKAMHQMLVIEGQDYTLYNGRTIMRKDSDRWPQFGIGRVIETADGQFWIGHLNFWSRFDELGSIIAEAYSTSHTSRLEKKRTAAKNTDS